MAGMGSALSLIVAINLLGIGGNATGFSIFGQVRPEMGTDYALASAGHNYFVLPDGIRLWPSSCRVEVMLQVLSKQGW